MASWKGAGRRGMRTLGCRFERTGRRVWVIPGAIPVPRPIPGPRPSPVPRPSLSPVPRPIRGKILEGCPARRIAATSNATRIELPGRSHIGRRPIERAWRPWRPWRFHPRGPKLVCPRSSRRDPREHGSKTQFLNRQERQEPGISRRMEIAGLHGGLNLAGLETHRGAQRAVAREPGPGPGRVRRRRGRV